MILQILILPSIASVVVASLLWVFGLEPRVTENSNTTKNNAVEIKAAEHRLRRLEERQSEQQAELSAITATLDAIREDVRYIRDNTTDSRNRNQRNQP